MSTNDSSTPKNPFEFLQSLWSANPVPLPGFVAPTLDADELAKRIADMKAVEGWLKLNLTMLQSTIQGLEVQAATIAALRAMPGNMADAMAAAAAASGSTEKQGAQAKSPKASARKR